MWQLYAQIALDLSRERQRSFVDEAELLRRLRAAESSSAIRRATAVALAAVGRATRSLGDGVVALAARLDCSVART